MRSWFFLAMLTVLPKARVDAVKRLTCQLTTDKGVAQAMYAAIDDSSDKAEVQLFALTAPCAQDRSCGIDIYHKELLPSVMRLTRVAGPSAAIYSTVIDVDRTTLSVVKRSKLETSLGSIESLAQGQCTMTVDTTKKAL